MTVEASRGNPRRDHEGAGQPNLKFSGVDRREKLCAEFEDVRTVNRHRWVRRAASGERVKPGQGTRHNDPVTSVEGMPARVARFARVALSGRSESAQATV